MEVITLTKEAFEMILKRLEQLENRYDHSPQQLQEDYLFKSEQVQQMLQMSESTLQRHRNSGRLAFYNLGRSVRYSLKDIETFIHHHQPERKIAC